MTARSTNYRNEFSAWLQRLRPEIPSKELFAALDALERLGTERRVLNAPLFETTDSNALDAVVREASRRLQWAREEGVSLAECDRAVRLLKSFLDERGGSADAFEEGDEEAEGGRKEGSAASDELIVDFNAPCDYSYTAPTRLLYFDQDDADFSSWTDLYLLLTSYLLADYPKRYALGMSFTSGTGRRPDLLTATQAGLKTSVKRIPNSEWYLETNCSADQFVAKIKYQLELCDVDCDSVLIAYRKKDVEPRRFVSSRLSQGVRVGGEEEFDRFLQRDGLTESTRRVYLAAIRSADRFAAERGFEERRGFYELDCDEAQAKADALFRDPEFCEIDKRRSRQLSSAITRALRYLGGDGAASVAPPSSPTPPDPPRVNPRALERILNALKTGYAGGFQFGPSEIRALANASGCDVSPEIQAELKRILFKRDDDRYYRADLIAEESLSREIAARADEALGANDFFCLDALFERVESRLALGAIRNLKDFEDFYHFLRAGGRASFPRPAEKRVGKYGWRIVLRQGPRSVDDAFGRAADKIYRVACDEFGGVVAVDDLLERFPLTPPELFDKLLRDYSETFVKGEINGVACFQTIDALGLPDDFPEALEQTFRQLKTLEIPASEEVLHALLSARLGENFRKERGILDDKVFRRLIVFYAPFLKWKAGVFAETGAETEAGA